MFCWKEEYSCKIKRIDEQHKRLFEIGQSIYDLATDEHHLNYYDRILDLIDDLREYTIYHFEDEERIMKLYDYPGYDEQKKIHDNFIHKIENINLDTIDEDPQKAVLKLLDFLYNWIGGHIIGKDLKIKDYFEGLKPIELIVKQSK